MKIKSVTVLCLTIFLTGCLGNQPLSEEQVQMLEKIKKAPEGALLIKTDESLFGVKSASNKDGSFSIKRRGGGSVVLVQLRRYIPHIHEVVNSDDPNYAKYLAKKDI